MSAISSVPNTSLYRIGGISAILGILLSIGYIVLPAALAVGALAFAVFIYALYRHLGAESPGLLLGGLVFGVGGVVLLAALILLNGSQNNALQNIAVWATFFSPPLFFGIQAYQQSRAGMSRTLPLIGAVGGTAGLLNLIFTLIGGGDWSNPNNPALGPLITGSYYLGMSLTLVWLVWTVKVLLTAKE